MEPSRYRPQHQVISLVALGAALLSLFAVLWLTRYLVLASLIGVGLGVIIAPLMNALQNRFRIPHGLSAILLVVLTVGGVGTLGYALFVLLSDQVQLLITKAPEITESVGRQADRIFDRFPWVENQLRKLNLGQAAKTAATSLFQGIQTSLVALAGSILVITVALYTAVHAKAYFQGLLSLFPAYLRPRTSEVLRKSASVLRQWFKSQLTVMAISGSATTLGLWILGIDYWLLLGVLTAILGFIPYVGAYISVAAAALVTIGSEPDKIWWVLGIYVAIQQLEGDVTIPLIMKGGVRLPEAHTIVFMLIMGSLFGLLGLFVAPPLLAVGREIILMTHVPKMDAKTLPSTASRSAAPQIEKISSRKSA